VPRKTSRKGALKRPHIVNVAGRWAQPYPYATTISIVFVCFCQKCKLKNTKGRMWGLLLPWSCSYATTISSCRIFFSGHTITWKKSFSGHHALPISMQDIDWTPSIWASMMFLKSWGIPSRHHCCFNTKMAIHDLDDLRVAPFQETAIYVKFPWCSWRWRTLRMDTLQDRNPGT
jgi:hypothetical protein